ncbi:MAG: hypothetical protein WCV56_03020 [Candidatus Omnitrophota bacterium]
MKIRDTILVGMIFTVAASLYVHQHAEIYKTGYDLQRDRKRLSCLVDRNSDLMYNLSKMETPRYLLTSLGGMEIQFAGKGRERVNSYSIAGLYDAQDRYEEAFPERVFDLFTATAEAGNRI